MSAAVATSRPAGGGEEAPNGNFTLLRLSAVGLLLYGNGVLLTGGPVPGLWGAPVPRVALDVLFAVSGYLAVESWRRRPGVVPFLRRRAARLLPALGASVLLTILVIGPLATSLIARHYFLNGRTLRYLLNAVLVPQLWLPGVFTGQQWGGAVNPVLWTLGAGVLLWLAVAATGRLRPRRAALVLLAAALLCAVAAHALGGHGPGAHNRLVLALTQAPFFLVAAALRHLSDEVADLWQTSLWRADLAVLLFAANWVVATWLAEENVWLEWVSLPYMVACFGRMTAPVIGRLGRLGDPSYGMFLLGFPVQQLIVARWPDLPHPVLTCFAACLLLGYASWHLVERPALALSERPLPFRLPSGRRARPAP